MNVLLDTNIVLDLLLDRDPFSLDAQNIFAKVEQNEINGYLCPTTITTLFYLLNKHISKKKSHEAIETLLEIFDTTNISKNVLLESLKNSGADFEDSVIYTSAQLSSIDFIITRDKKGFKKSKVKILTPAEFLIRLT